jgi:hypothetical protein
VTVTGAIARYRGGGGGGVGEGIHYCIYGGQSFGPFFY